MRRRTLYLKVLLSGNLKPLFLKKRQENKEFHYELLKTVVAQMFCKAFYPHNIDINAADNLRDFITVRMSTKGILLLVRCILVAPERFDARAFERDVRAHNISPEFVKYVKIVNKASIAQ